MFNLAYARTTMAKTPTAKDSTETRTGAEAKTQTRGKAPALSTDKSIADLNKRVTDAVEKRTRTQRQFPACSFEEATVFAKQLLQFGSGKPARRISLFDHIGKSPDSGPSRQLITNSSKYGLTKGGYQADMLELTPEGSKAVDDDQPKREQAKARILLAVENVPVFKSLYDTFAGSKLPSNAALVDAAKETGLSDELAAEAVETFTVNLRYLGLLQTLSGAERILKVDHYLDTLPQSAASYRPSTPGAVPAPPGASQVPAALITLDQAQFETTCFYVTPIGDPSSEERKHSDLMLGSIVEPALEGFGLSVIRADQIDKPGTITRQVFDYLLKARLVIVDLSFHNPNVFYELAIRHAARLPVVQIIRVADKIPFDVNQMRTIPIDTTSIFTLVPQLQSYIAQVASHVRRALQDPDSADNPLSTFYPNFRVQL